MSTLLADRYHEEVEWLELLMKDAVETNERNNTPTRHRASRQLTNEEFERVIDVIQSLGLIVELFPVGYISPSPACRLWTNSKKVRLLFVIQPKHCPSGSIPDIDQALWLRSADQLHVAFFNFFHPLSSTDENIRLLTERRLALPQAFDHYVYNSWK